MRRIFISLALLFFILSFSGNFSLSILNLTTMGLDDGAFDYFPILYVTYQPFDFLAFKVTDYLELSHDSWNLGTYSIFKPRYYYLEGKFDLFGYDVKLDVLKTRLKKSQTEKLEGLRVGGLKFDYYGAGLDVKIGKINLGAAYDLGLGSVAGYVQADLFGFKLGGYYETKYNQISLDVNRSFDLGNFSILAWTALSAKSSDIANFSYLVGGKVNFNNLALSTQFLSLGVNRYDADFQTGDPNDVAFLPNAWAYYLDVDYALNDYVLGVFLRYNSVWASDPNYLPLYGLKLAYKDFTLKVGNGDLESNIAGEQKIIAELNYFYSLEFDKLFSFNSKLVTPVEEKKKEFNSIMDVILGEEGKSFVVKGIVTSPKDLLGKGSFYIQDETAGLMIYSPVLGGDLNVGDVVVISGKSKLWNGVIELVANNVEKVGSAKVIPDVLTSLSKTFISAFVYVEGVVKEKNKYNFKVDTGDFIIKVYLKKGTNIDISNLNVGQKVKVQGILAVYKGEYEILPRWQEDIEIR
ncbi:DNA-binding protein [Thermosipho sp. 1074]|uniref:DNA-binding protein n=1 Tax=Thermosipho sp. 1074 TaxID=1643331 RepID=UPI000984CF60|nr:DNA-binding protein [Thermosipho sp. 1074]OOC44131.1 DNA-binding protein [Thermosipho sp. 1074]